MFFTLYDKLTLLFLTRAIRSDDTLQSITKTSRLKVGGITFKLLEYGI
jgi:hypothetical protein